MTKETDFKKIYIHDMTIDDLKRVTLDDLHAYLAYLTRTNNSKATTRARKVCKYKSIV